jgi:hypothetical protein
VNIAVVSPSYKRADKITTHKYLPFIKFYVDESEEGEYRKHNPGVEIIACPRGIQGNVCRVRNYILDREFEAGADAVVMLDDDLKGIYYWENMERKEVKPEEFLWFIEKYSILAREWGARMWGVNVNQDKQVYREYSPFTTKSPVLGPFQVHLRGSDIRYDERLALKEDYDMSLQQLNRYRVLLRVMKAFYECKQSEQPGGCSTYRNLEREKEQLLLLRKKWGKEIVRVDKGGSRSHNAKRERKTIDYNPIIRVPIKGV